MIVVSNDKSIFSRLAQMTQKTNQFNLTTKRYTENEIQSYSDNNNYIVIAISIKDYFGDSGITGLCILEINSNKKYCTIDTLLMSCRIIGRNIEYAFLDCIVKKCQSLNLPVIKATFVKTNKNNQVMKFYEKCSLWHVY